MKLEKVRHYILSGSSPTQWEVTSSTSSWNVDLEKKTCSCMEWQIVGIPCQHAVCVIHRKRGAWTNYCSLYFKNKALKATYNGAIVSMSPGEDWDESRIKCLAPLKQRQPGRPTKNRKRAQGENDKGKNLCPICKVYGHNSRTCKYGLKGANTKYGLPLPPLPPRPQKQPKRWVGQELFIDLRKYLSEWRPQMQEVIADKLEEEVQIEEQEEEVQEEEELEE